MPPTPKPAPEGRLRRPRLLAPPSGTQEVAVIVIRSLPSRGAPSGVAWNAPAPPPSSSRAPPRMMPPAVRPSIGMVHSSPCCTAASRPPEEAFDDQPGAFQRIVQQVAEGLARLAAVLAIGIDLRRQQAVRRDEAALDHDRAALPGTQPRRPARRTGRCSTPISGTTSTAPSVADGHLVAGEAARRPDTR